MLTESLDIPEEFLIKKSNGCTLIYNTHFVSPDGVDEWLLIPNSLEDLPAEASRSKHLETVWELKSADGFPHDMVVRKYVHGGIVGGLIGPLRTLFLNPGPMLNELKISTHLWKIGFPTAQPIALYLQSQAGPVFTAIFISKKIPHAVNMLKFCTIVQKGELSLTDEIRSQVLAKIAELIKRLHKEGVYHGDLNLKNILIGITPEATNFNDEVYVIDFKKAVFERNITEKKGLLNIKRLWRSVLKWPAAAATFKETDDDTLSRVYKTR